MLRFYFKFNEYEDFRVLFLAPFGVIFLFLLFPGGFLLFPLWNLGCFLEI